MAQKQWGLVDRANNSPLWAPAQVGAVANTVTREALFNNTTPDAYITGATVGTYGVSKAEMATAVVGQVASVTVTTSGSGFTVRPTVVFSAGGAGATQATGNTTAKVLGPPSTTIYDGGADYAPGDVVQIATAGAAGGTVAAKFNVLTVNASTNAAMTISINTAGSFTTLPTAINNNLTTNVTGAGAGLRLNLSFGLNTVTLTTNGTGYTSAPTVTIGGTGGTGAVATAALASEERGVTHAGWVLRKAVGSRVQYETLVATKNISSDATDDTKFPE